MCVSAHHAGGGLTHARAVRRQVESIYYFAPSTCEQGFDINAIVNGSDFPPGLQVLVPGRSRAEARCAQGVGGEQQRIANPWARERTGSPTLQTLHEPILLLPWVCLRGGGFSNPSVNRGLGVISG